MPAATSTDDVQAAHEAVVRRSRRSRSRKGCARGRLRWRCRARWRRCPSPAANRPAGQRRAELVGHRGREVAGHQRPEDRDADRATHLASRVVHRASPTPALARGSEPMIESVHGAMTCDMPTAISIVTTMTWNVLLFGSNVVKSTNDSRDDARGRPRRPSCCRSGCTQIGRHRSEDHHRDRPAA